MNKSGLKKIIKEAFTLLNERGEWYDLPSQRTERDMPNNTEDSQDPELERDELFSSLTRELLDEEGYEFKKEVVRTLMTDTDLLLDILDSVTDEIKDSLMKKLGGQNDPRDLDIA